MTADKYTYLYNGTPDSAAVSVYPVVCLSSDALQIDIPAVPVGGDEVVYSVRNSGKCAYRWLKSTTGKRFAEIFITVSAEVRRTVRRAIGYIRCAMSCLRMSLTFRRTVCLRL